jgi:hypothetical protein
MSKLSKLRLCLLVLSFVFFLNPSGAVGQEGCIVPTVPGNVEDIEKWLALQWAPGHPPAEIQPGTNALVKVVGGFPPIQWSVSGNGFSLGEVEENGVDHARNKLLIASPTACGTATIEVVDKYGLAVTGYVRCKAGQWINTGDHVCRPPCEATIGGGGRPWCGYDKKSCISGNLRYCYVFCPSPCANHCPPEICLECGPYYYYTQEWICP